MSIATLPAVANETLRKAELSALIDVLRRRHAQKLDIVAPTSTLRSYGGNLMMGGLDEIIVPAQPAKLTATGVTEAVEAFAFDPSGLYWPTHYADADIASAFDIPLRYLRRLRVQDLELFDINVNRWAEKAEGNSLFRLLYGTSDAHPGTIGMVRAVRSDRFAMYDNLDTVMSILSGIKEAGLDGSTSARSTCPSRSSTSTSRRRRSRCTVAA